MVFNQRGSVGIIFLIILLILSLSVAGAGFMLLQKEKTLRAGAEEQLQDLEVKYRITEDNLRTAEEKATELEVRLVSAEDDLESMQEDLMQAIEERDNSVSKMEQIRQDLENQGSEKDVLENQLNDARGEIDRLNQQIQELESERSELQGRIGDQGVELDRIIVNQPPQDEGDQPREEQENRPQEEGAEDKGKILVVNKEYSFVVVDLGKNDGIKMGDVLSVYRGNNLLGDISVEKVHDAMSAANMLSEKMGSRVKEGDRVEIKQQ